MGVPFTMAHGSIRFSLSIYNTEAEIDLVIEKFPPVIEELRTMSPYWGAGQEVCATRTLAGCSRWVRRSGRKNPGRSLTTSVKPGIEDEE